MGEVLQNHSPLWERMTDYQWQDIKYPVNQELADMNHALALVNNFLESKIMFRMEMEQRDKNKYPMKKLYYSTNGGVDWFPTEIE